MGNLDENLPLKNDLLFIKGIGCDQLFVFCGHHN